jgi:hypothetical protein
MKIILTYIILLSAAYSQIDILPDKTQVHGYANPIEIVNAIKNYNEGKENKYRLTENMIISAVKFEIGNAVRNKQNNDYIELLADIISSNYLPKGSLIRKYNSENKNNIIIYVIFGLDKEPLDKASDPNDVTKIRMIPIKIMFME